nr:uncharacterized protein LOC113695786 [Coffea arabica]
MWCNSWAFPNLTHSLFKIDSAADSRVLRDALVRSDPLIVPKGKYFLVDAGYANSSGFLAPYRGVRYHLSEWSASGRKPQNFKELFNLRHSIARNVIERTFGLFKKRWAILRDASFFDVKTHVMIINACAILHNLIRVEQPNDPYLDEVDAEMRRVQHEVDDEDEMEDENEENGMEDDGPKNTLFVYSSIEISCKIQNSNIYNRYKL